MNKQFTFSREYIYGRYITTAYSNNQDKHYSKDSFYHHPVLDASQASSLIKNVINTGTPFMAGRFGANELSAIKTFDFEITSKYQKTLSILGLNAGFFPQTIDAGMHFKDIMISEIPSADLIGIWPLPFEGYYLKQYGSPDLKYTWLRYLEPWQCIESPWSAALKGKKVLVIHPFAESIAKQYKKRELLFPKTGILPQFDLEILQSVQTSGGNIDSRFHDWFEALNWMKKEVSKKSFDIALLGCGAYGFPLAAHIKKEGRQAIHLGGATQILFGIMGTRWENDPAVQKLKNDAWIRPSNSERPKNASNIENACYW